MKKDEYFFKEIAEEEYVIKPIITVCKMFLAQLTNIEKKYYASGKVESALPRHVKSLLVNMENMIDQYNQEENES